MCLSSVYAEEKKQDRLVIEEAAQVRADHDGVYVRALFGESKKLEGYYISEVDFMENHLILRGKRG